MKKSSNVQKSNELKEAEMSAKENSSNAMTRKITFIGDNAISLYTNRRYLSLSLLVKLMSDSLDEDLPFEVNLTCLTLEAFAKAFKELGDYEFSLLIFKNLEPLNFFKLLNDISTQTYYNSSKEVSNKFLTSEKVIKKLNRFYNEYYEIYDYCLKNNYTSLYLFEITAMNNNETLKNQYKNLGEYLHSNDRKKRHIVSSLFNELENETRRCGITEATANDYYYKLMRIDKEINNIFEKIDLNKIYSIDSLYFSIL